MNQTHFPQTTSYATALPAGQGPSQGRRSGAEPSRSDAQAGQTPVTDERLRLALQLLRPLKRQLDFTCGGLLGLLHEGSQDGNALLSAPM